MPKFDPTRDWEKKQAKRERKEVELEHQALLQRIIAEAKMQEAHARTPAPTPASTTVPPTPTVSIVASGITFVFPRAQIERELVTQGFEAVGVDQWRCMFTATYVIGQMKLAFARGEIVRLDGGTVTPARPEPQVIIEQRPDHMPIDWLREAQRLIDILPYDIVIRLVGNGVEVVGHAGREYRTFTVTWAAAAAWKTNPILHAVTVVQEKFEAFDTFKKMVESGRERATA